MNFSIRSRPREHIYKCRDDVAATFICVLFCSGIEMGGSTLIPPIPIYTLVKYTNMQYLSSVQFQLAASYLNAFCTPMSWYNYRFWLCTISHT